MATAVETLFDAEASNTDSRIFSGKGRKASIMLDITNATVTLKSTNDPASTVFYDVTNGSYTADDHFIIDLDEAEGFKLTITGNTGTVSAWLKTYEKDRR